jgi:energy-coupling factor transporter ATP-binding protein EcfA2
VLETGLLRGVLPKLPEGLQTYLGEGGARLSGGEGQRLRLARALMQPNVRLALLDEPFRGLDRSQRARLLRESRAWWRDVTLMCISHDIAETLSFDRVLVVEDGRVVEDGDPRVLRQRPSRYRVLLEAEDRLNREMWAGDDWRRIVLRDGIIVADDTPQQRENVMHFVSRFKAADGQASGQALRGAEAGGDHGR